MAAHGALLGAGSIPRHRRLSLSRAEEEPCPRCLVCGAPASLGAPLEPPATQTPFFLLLGSETTPRQGRFSFRREALLTPAEKRALSPLLVVYQGNKTSRLGGGFLRLRGRDSNPDYLIQSQASYH
jgi:hypothetical protein